MIKPKLIILDEPFRGLDINAILVTKYLFKEYVKNGGTLLICSHDLLLIEQICDDVLILDDGIIKAQGSPKKLIKNYNVNDLEELFKKISGKDVIEDVKNFFAYK